MRNAGFFNREKCDGRNRGWNAVTVVLFICALPVLIPLVCGIGAALLGAVLALAGGGLAVVVGVAGGVLAVLAGTAGCMVAAAVGLAALLFCAFVGIGVGLVLLFSAPASALAILGVSLMMAGAGALGCLLFWQLCVWGIWTVRKLTGWAHVRILHGRERRAARAVRSAFKKEDGQDA